MTRKLVAYVVGDSASFERSMQRSSRATKTFGRDVDKAGRGALAGSKLFGSLGRSIAFASGGFLAFGGAASFLRTSIDAARDAAVVEKQLAAQFRSTGRSLSTYRSEIEHTSESLSSLTGFNKDDLQAAFTTILRTQPNVSKALRDTATAADLARARHISLAAAATILAKVEGGNTTLLRRQGIQVAKNATREQALATLRNKVAGQAAAGATEQEKFGATLHTTEEIIGKGILPTLNTYLRSGGKWLEQMNESGKLQKDVTKDAHAFAAAIKQAAGIVRAVDHVTGSFAHTLELLAGLKLASMLAGWVRGFQGLLVAETAAEAKASLLSKTLARLKGIGVITIALALVPANKKGQNALDNLGLGGAGRLPIIGDFIQQSSELGVNIHNKLFGGPSSGFGQNRSAQAAKDFLHDEVLAAQAQGAHGQSAAQLAGRIHAGDSLTQPPVTLVNPDTGRAGVKLTRTQQNTFFDNAISRQLNRAANATLPAQLKAYDRIVSELKARLAKTKDVTRRLTLEDQIISAEAQKADARTAIRQKFLDSLANAAGRSQFLVGVAQSTAGFQDDIVALTRLEGSIEKQIKAEGRTNDLVTQLFETRQQIAAARLSQRSAGQFAALGLSPTGDAKVPGVSALRRSLGHVTEQISGTILDTKKVHSLLGRIRKVLSGGLGEVGADVRTKVAGILSGLEGQLDKSTGKNLTKWKHLSSQAFLAGVPDLTPAQRRQLSARFATVGAGGTVPGGSSAAFSLAGATVHSEVTVQLDSTPVAKAVTSKQIRRSKKRTLPRGV